MPLKPPKKKSGIKLYVLIFFLFPFFISMDDIYKLVLEKDGFCYKTKQ